MDIAPIKTELGLYVENITAELNGHASRKFEVPRELAARGMQEIGDGLSHHYLTNGYVKEHDSPSENGRSLRFKGRDRNTIYATISKRTQDISITLTQS